MTPNTVPPTPPAALRFAEWSARLTWADIPDAQRRLVASRVLDTVGLIFAVLEIQPARAVLDIATAQGGAPESRVIGTAHRLPASWAALANATLAHCRDFDDTFSDSVVHPGSVVVPTALAVAEATGAPAQMLGTAIVAGYEAAARLGAAAGKKFHANGLHATGVVGPLAAAVAAARLYGLTPDGTAKAMGLAGSMSGGLMEFLTDGAWSKWLHTGWAAHGGILAAQLAGRGFGGPPSVLDGPNGLYRALIGAGEAELDRITEGLGIRWHGGEALFKYYPAAANIQPFIDAALKLRAEHDLKPDKVDEVLCAIQPWCVPIVCEPREIKLAPAGALDAVVSLPFQVAVALAEGTVTLAALEPAMLHRSDLRAGAARVRHVADPTLSGQFDGRIEIRTTGGQLFSAAAPTPPADAGKVRAKFRANGAITQKADRLDGVIAAFSADGLPDFQSLLPLLGG